MNNKKKLIKISMALLAFITIFIFTSKRHSPAVNVVEAKGSTRSINEASADNVNETIATLSAEVRATREAARSIDNENKKLRRENKNILNKMQRNITVELKDELLAQKQELSAKIMQVEKGIVASKRNSNHPNHIQDMSDDIIGNIADLSTMSGDLVFSDLANNKFVDGRSKKSIKIAQYTIPENATLTEAKLMSSMIGRIPIKGRVIDPYMFKIIVGNDNLAANGFAMPKLQGIVASGYAEGDLALTCVRGWIHSMTMVFDDGTIKTIRSNSEDGASFNKGKNLGWLSDPHGNPCLPGKLYSNAARVLGGNVLLAASQSAANAMTTAQMDNHYNPLGGGTSQVAGSMGKYTLGEATVGATKEIGNWWNERQEDSFDAIYIEAGKSVVINITKTLAIDYDKEGRKLDYGNDKHE